MFSSQEQHSGNIDAGDNAHLLYITSALNEILKKLDGRQKSCNEGTDTTSGERFTHLEDAISRITNDLTGLKENVIDRISRDMYGVKSTLINVKDDINENRQYASSKYHELRADVNDNQETGIAKQREIKQSVDELRQAMNGNVAKKTGTTYVRWGRTTCPNGADVAYTGYAGGSWYNHEGAASSMLCLPKDPDWALYTNGVQSRSGYVYGAEYEPSDDRTDKFFGKDHSQHDVPCTVCSMKSRSSSIMVPGKKTCPVDWSLEYWGYLMSGYYLHKGATDYYCIDAEAETLPGGAENKDGHLLYFVESRCGSLACPPYVEGRELTCVVCSK